jgi:hypothetical protein
MYLEMLRCTPWILEEKKQLNKERWWSLIHDKLNIQNRLSVLFLSASLSQEDDSFETQIKFEIHDVS